VALQQPTDEALFAEYLAGDADAFRLLILRWTPPLRATMRRGGIPASDIDDMVQDVFLHLHRSSPDFVAGAPLRPWIITIALNLRRDWQRRPAHRAEWVDLPDLPDVMLPSQPLERQEVVEQVRQALSELPDAQRQAVELHWLEALPFGEVARLVGASVGAVRVRAHRGYERIRAALTRRSE
jgi:RNA polymerase sigma factor (sigma-70 family)